MCTMSIHDVSPTIWKGKVTALIEVDRLLNKEIDYIYSPVLLFVEFLFAQISLQRDLNK